MLIKNPKQFNRVAKEWAIRYAGAPKHDDAEGSVGSAADEAEAEDEAASLAAWVQNRPQLYVYLTFKQL